MAAKILVAACAKIKLSKIRDVLLATKS